MKIQHHINRRNVKYLTVYALGVAGIIIAVVAVILSQDQLATLTQISQELATSPVSSVINSIVSLF